MAFHATHSVQLLNWTLSGHRDTPLSSGTLSWSGWSPTPFSGTVTDNQTPNALDRNGDFFGAQGNTFTGYHVNIGGQNFGIFQVGSMRVIPYNPAQFDITSVFPNAASSTVAFSPTLTTAANCFLTGTRIATPTGPRPIETLTPGEPLLGAEGHTIALRWIWRQPVARIVGLDDDRAPVRITAHAFAQGCQDSDLMLSRDHAIWIDGFLVTAGALVNGTSIRHVPMSDMPAQFTYWHLETDDHSLILAENCPAESFVPYTARSAHDGHGAYLARYGQDRVIAEMRLPRIGAARLVPAALRARLGIGHAA